MPDNQQSSRPGAEERRRKWADMMRDTSTDLAHKMALVAFDMDALKSPEDALIRRISAAQDAKPGDYGFVDFSTSQATQEVLLKHLEQYEKAYFASIVQEVAAQTGADPAQIANKETRTQEQQKALLEASARRQLVRMDRFFNSNYMAVLSILQDTHSIFDPDPANTEPLADEDNPDVWGFKESFLWYYFTTRPDLRPSEENSITDTDKAAIIEAYKRFDAFLLDYFGDLEKAKRCEDKEYLIAIKAFIAQENPTDAAEIIERLTSVLPAKYVMPNNKLANTMIRGIIDVGEITLEVSRKGAKKLVETTCVLTYEGDNVHLSGRQPFTEYDRNVYNAVSSLYVYGDQSHIITPAMVYRAMTGLTDTEKPTAQQLAAVTRSLDKMRFIRARIDCTEELKMRRITLNSNQINGGEIDTYLLTADAIKVQAGGQTVRAYRIIKTPILYEYAAAVKQVLTVPAYVLDVRETSEITIDGKKKLTIGTRLPNTESRILIKGYLIRRIEGMKGKNKLDNNVIALYDYEKDDGPHKGLYSTAGKPDADRKEMQRIREDAEKMLSYWVARGYIKSFKTKTERKKITGYIITTWEHQP